MIEISTNRLYVHNLSWRVSWQDLKDHFRQAGEVVHTKILTEGGPGGRSKGCGIVEMATIDEAARAVEMLSDTNLDGRNILIREDREDRANGGGPTAPAPAAAAATPPAPTTYATSAAAGGTGRGLPVPGSASAGAAPPRGRENRSAASSATITIAERSPSARGGSPGPTTSATGAARRVTGPGTARCPATRTRRFARGAPASPSRMTSARSAGRRATGPGTAPPATAPRLPTRTGTRTWTPAPWTTTSTRTRLRVPPPMRLAPPRDGGRVSERRTKKTEKNQRARRRVGVVGGRDV